MVPNSMTPAQRSALVRRRVELRAAIRIARLAFDTIDPGTDRAWARKWAAGKRRKFAAELRKLRAELCRLDAVLGPPPKAFKPRSAAGFRCSRNAADPKHTGQMWS